MKRITYDDFLDMIQTFSQQKDWDGLESYFHQYCEGFVSADVAAAIKNVDLDKCEPYLRDKATEALSLAKVYNVKAVYYEYNVQNDWASNFYICPQYNSIEMQDDDWVVNFIPLVNQPEEYEPSLDTEPFKFPDFLYQCEGVEERTVVEYYLIARTTALFGRATETIAWGNIALCIGFHDQQIVTRIYEPENMNGGK
jgi:hypothetical protein